MLACPCQPRPQGLGDFESAIPAIITAAAQIGTTIYATEASKDEAARQRRAQLTQLQAEYQNILAAQQPQPAPEAPIAMQPISPGTILAPSSWTTGEKVATGLGAAALLWLILGRRR